MSKAAISTLGVGEGMGNSKTCHVNGEKSHLGNSVAVVYGKGTLTVVYQRNLNFASVVGINNTDGIGESDATLYGKSAAGKKESNGARFTFHRNTRGDKSGLTGVEHYRLVNAGTHIHSRRAGSLVRGNNGTLAQLFYFNVNILHIFPLKC
jgi:hypothetical protein